MKVKKASAALMGSTLGMLILILDSKTALLGIQQGIELCLRTVIPSLFPFFFISNLITSSMLGKENRLLRYVGKFCGIPSGAESLLLTALLGGYPVGAQIISQACNTGTLSKDDGRRMLGFCNNPGPAFIFGMVASLFSSPAAGWTLWISIILSSLFTGFLLPEKANGHALIRPVKESTPTSALTGSISVMSYVCGWVILFRLLIVFLQRWFLWMFPTVVQVLIAGILELSNGCISLDSIAQPGLRYLMCAGFLCLGGCCVTMQTASAAGNLGLKYYFPGKILQASIGIILSYGTQFFLFSKDERVDNWLFPATIFITGVICVKILQKTCRKKLPLGV